MSLLDCIRPKVSQVTFRLVQDQYSKLLALHGNDEGAAAIALAKWWQEQGTAFKNTRIKQALKTEAMLKQVDTVLKHRQDEWNLVADWAKPLMKKLGKEPTYDRAVEEVLILTDHAARVRGDDLLKQLDKVFETITPKGIQLAVDHKSMEMVVEGLIDGSDNMTDPVLRGVAKQIEQVFKKGLNDYRAAGGIIGEINNYFPVKHNAGKIGGVSYDVWREAYESAFKWEKILNSDGKPISRAEWDVISHNMYRDIVTNNTSRAERQMAKHGRVTDPNRIQGLFARRNQGRLAEPRNAAAFLDYNTEFGIGREGLYTTLIAHVEGLGRDTGIMQRMGPLPEDTFTLLRDLSQAKGADAKRLGVLKGLYRTLTGSWAGSSDDLLMVGAGTMQSLASANLLGSASAAALADTAFIASAKRLYGITGGSALASWVSSLASPHDQMRALHAANRMAGVSVSRFDGEMAMSTAGKVRRGADLLKNVNYQISGLSRISEATGDVMSIGFAAELGKYADDAVAFADVEPNFRRMLERHMINEKDWDALREYGADEDGFIFPQQLPDKMESLRFRLDNVNAEMRIFATNAPDLKIRYYSTGNFAGERTRGDLMHIISSSVMQFKSFPIMVWRNHMVPALMRAAQGNLTPVSMLMLQTTFLGGMVVQLKELIKGDAMYDPMNNPGDFLARSLWQGGFAGLMGDVMFKDPDRFGRNLLVDMAGPVPGMTSETLLAAASLSKSMFTLGELNTHQLRRAMRPYVPLGTLWYARAAVDRMAMDTLNTIIDSDFHDTVNRYNSRQQEERGATGWWMRGDILPGG